jgi:integrase
LSQCAKNVLNGAMPRKPSKQTPKIFKRPNSPWWWVRYQEPERDADGVILRHEVGGVLKVKMRQVRRSTKTELEAKARALLVQWEAEALRATAAPELEDEKALLAKRKADAEAAAKAAHDRRLTMGQLRDRWLEQSAGKKSITSIRPWFAVIVAFFGADRPIDTLTRSDVEALVAHLRATPNVRGKKNTPATINRYLEQLRAALRWIGEEHPHRDPMRGVSKLPEKNERDRIVTPAEYRRLVEAAPPSIRLAIVIGYHTAMRAGEIVNLTWDRVDLDAGFARLRAGDTKTGKPRNVPLAPPVVEALRAAKRRPDGRLFGMQRQTLSPNFAKLVRKLGMADLHFHDLRHTALTNLRRAGADVFTLQRISGHTTLAMLKRYTHSTDDDAMAAVLRASTSGATGAK